MRGDFSRAPAGLLEPGEDLSRNAGQVRGRVDGVPVETHEATITVTGTGSGSHVTWVVESTPDEMADLMQGVYQGSLEALKAHVEG